jgi:hypothetical protein
MKTHLESAGIDILVLGLDTRWRLSGQLHVPAALPPGKELRVPIGP